MPVLSQITKYLESLLFIKGRGWEERFAALQKEAARRSRQRPGHSAGQIEMALPFQGRLNK
jgi:hypothetical protein